MLVICRAHALAHTGQVAEAVAEVRRAQDLAVRGGDEMPYWLTLSGTPRAAVDTHAAKIFRVLRDRRLAVFELRGVGAAVQLDERARSWQVAHA
ncbi:hypothetical protein [Streptomyces sp. NPDC057554]|uniref:hypothetical protein n=1 Tax=Streptomyces sp. NPDC057554 TaxID=3350538 RepID=UPI0036B42D35